MLEVHPGLGSDLNPVQRPMEMEMEMEMGLELVLPVVDLDQRDLLQLQVCMIQLIKVSRAVRHRLRSRECNTYPPTISPSQSDLPLYLSRLIL